MNSQCNRVIFLSRKITFGGLNLIRSIIFPHIGVGGGGGGTGNKFLELTYDGTKIKEIIGNSYQVCLLMLLEVLIYEKLTYSNENNLENESLKVKSFKKFRLRRVLALVEPPLP